MMKMITVMIMITMTIMMMMIMTHTRGFLNEDEDDFDDCFYKWWRNLGVGWTFLVVVVLMGGGSVGSNLTKTSVALIVVKKIILTNLASLTTFLRSKSSSSELPWSASSGYLSFLPVTICTQINIGFHHKNISTISTNSITIIIIIILDWIRKLDVRCQKHTRWNYSVYQARSSGLSELGSDWVP